MGNFIDRKLQFLLAAGLAAPLVFMLCAATGITSESIASPEYATLKKTGPYVDGGHRGAIPLEKSEGWQLRLRAL